MRIVPFQPEHALQIKLQSMQQTGESEDDYTGVAVTGIDDDGEIVFCGGKSDTDPCILWALLSDRAKDHLLVITRVARRIMALHSGKLWATVHCDFEPANRWVTMLGFRLYGRAKKLFPDGTDAYVYVRDC